MTTPADPADPILVALIPICDVLGRLVGALERLSARVDVLELELAYRREADPPCENSRL